jgi:hypothetical protein
LRAQPRRHSAPAVCVVQGCPPDQLVEGQGLPSLRLARPRLASPPLGWHVNALGGTQPAGRLALGRVWFAYASPGPSGAWQISPRATKVRVPRLADARAGTRGVETPARLLPSSASSARQHLRQSHRDTSTPDPQRTGREGPLWVQRGGAIWLC